VVNSILVPLNDSPTSGALIDFLVNLPVCPGDASFTLVHVFRQPTSGEELMGKKFMAEQPHRFKAVLQKAKDRLVKEGGFEPHLIDIQLLTDPYPSVTEGIIDFFKKGRYDMVVIGRRKMSKSEEFVRGDISIKLVRTLDHASILVVTA
jgi:nucleotide-binding universal stress UspA family protein